MFLRANGFFANLLLAFAGMFAPSLYGNTIYQDIYEYARAHRSDLTSIEYDITRALQNENIALSGLFPLVTLNGTKQQQRGDIWANGQVVLGLSMSIYEPAGPMARWWLAQTETDLIRWSKENLFDDIRYEIGQSFFSYRNMLNKKSLTTALDQSSREQFEKAKASYKQGVISDVEFEQARALFENTQSRVRSYSNDISISKNNLALASERSIDGPVDKLSSEKLYSHLLEAVAPYTPDKFVIEALACRKELRVADQQIAAEIIKKDIARYSYIPTVKFVANLERLWGPPLYETTHPYFFGISIDWTFDLGNLFRFRSAEASRLKAVFDRKRAEFSIENEVRTACDQLEIVVKDVVAVRAKLEEARITFERNKREHEIGLLSDIDFKRAETEWEQAQFNLEDTITKAAQKHEELLWDTGYPKSQPSCFDLLEKTL